MSRRNIMITSSDLQRLQQLLESDFAAAIDPKSYLVDLQEELHRAEIVDAADVPDDVVTMDSTVRLRDMITSEVETYSLVYPDQANIAQNKLSILAPIGTAILGYRVGDIVRWRVPSGSRWLRVEEVVYQPERQGVLQNEG